MHEKSILAVTLNIIAMAGVFLICQTPDFVHTVISWKFKELDQRIEWETICVSVTHLSFNTSVNAMIYCVFYRGLIIQVLTKMTCRSQGDAESGTSNSERMGRVTSLSSEMATTEV